MTASDIRPKADDRIVPGLARWLWAALAVMGFEAIWFLCRFIVPRYEAALMGAGTRPSAGLRGALIASFLVAKYFWWMAPLLVVGLLISRGSSSRTDRGQG